MPSVGDEGKFSGCPHLPYYQTIFRIDDRAPVIVWCRECGSLRKGGGDWRVPSQAKHLNDILTRGSITEKRKWKRKALDK